MRKRHKMCAAIILICCLCLNITVYAAEPAVSVKNAEKVKEVKNVRILMVGNSLTYCFRNYTIRDLKELAKKDGKRLTVKRLTYNNEKMKNWANPKNNNGRRLYAELKKGGWDYVILQEQTDASVSQSFLKANKKIVADIRAKCPNAQIIYNCTWAYKKGKRVSGKYYSFSTMQRKMNQNYQAAARAAGGRVCWSGKAFLKYRRSSGTKKNLYLRDNNHASKYGWYLNACCLYKSIFEKNPAGIKYYAGVGKKQAQKLQQAAGD